ncbi:hypothetical protein AJ79_01069 [Helicocarpus griseus UAMH5409]|uniref:Flavin-nucleotide-binding protein n=1 Tax=Helicocarpus griseus UAMH5409 TaxID=1447875 RepID=A0A2B7Y8P8_9EURO|nr:hypothetical protein AJ79_01069 [Helicocarpus griseus UAMH5409]
MQPAELRRHNERGKYDADSISSVFSDTFMAHVSYIDDGLPQCLPMIALFRSEDEGEAVYLHGHPSSRLMELIRRNEAERRTSLEGGESMNEIKDDRIKVCITATKVDSLVLSSAPNGNTFNYRSAVVHGACSRVEDRNLKRDIMHAVTNHIVPVRWEDVNPVASFQISLVFVIRVEVQRGSLKMRTGIPGIQPRDPVKDGPDRDEPVWTGVVPLSEQLGEPVPSGLTNEAEVPEGLLTFIGDRNKRQNGYARSVAR